MAQLGTQETGDDGAHGGEEEMRARRDNNGSLAQRRLQASKFMQTSSLWPTRDEGERVPPPGWQSTAKRLCCCCCSAMVVWKVEQPEPGEGCATVSGCQPSSWQGGRAGRQTDSQSGSPSGSLAKANGTADPLVAPPLQPFPPPHHCTAARPE